MKKLENIKVVDLNGKPIVNDEKQIDTVFCIKAVLDNSEYRIRLDQKTADKISDKLSKKEDLKVIELEDAEYEMVKRYILMYKPFLTGRVFSKILNQFDGESN